MKNLFSVCLFLFCICIGFSQSDSEKKAIKQTIENYFVGYDKGDVELLKKAFHPDCVIKYLDIKSKKYSTFTMDQLNKFMKNLPSGWSSEPKLFNIDYHGTAAQAKVSVYIKKFKLTWTDFISLLKIDGKWTIVSKISHGDIGDKN